MSACECQGRGTLGVPCDGRPAEWVAACEALLCGLCASIQHCCACGSRAPGHYRLLVAEGVAS